MIPTVFTPAFTMWPTSASAMSPSFCVVLNTHRFLSSIGSTTAVAPTGASIGVPASATNGDDADGIGRARRTDQCIDLVLGDELLDEDHTSASHRSHRRTRGTRRSNRRSSSAAARPSSSAECRPPRSRRSTRRSRRSSTGPTPAPRPARWRAQWNAGRWVSCAGSSLSTDRRLLACVAGILPNERNARASPGALRRTAPRAAYRGTRARRRASRARGPRPPAFASTASRSEVSPIFSTASANSSVSPTLLGARKSHSTCAIGIPCRSSV